MSTKIIFRTCLVGTLALLMLGCAGGSAPAAEVEPEVETTEPSAVEEADTQPESEEREPVVQEQPQLTVLADGQIRNGRPALPLAFETSGKLVQVHVEVGDEVAAGDVLATLDAVSLQEAVTSAELRVKSAENNLLQRQSELDKLKTWEPDESAIAIAEANIKSAETNLKNAETRDAARGSSLTSVNVQIQQAQRELNNAQEAYDNAFSEARDWETQYHEKVCETINGIKQCANMTWAERIKADREGSTARLQHAKEQLQVARANWSVQAAQNIGNSAIGVEAQLVAAQQELARAQKGPTEDQISAAELNLEQAKLSLEQEKFALTKAENALDKSQIVAPWNGTIQTISATPGGMVGAGSPIVTLIDVNGLEFVTTNLSERDLDQITIGQEAQITLKTYPNDPISGSVARIDLSASGTVGDAAVFPVVIQFSSDELTVRQGMTGRVEILHDK